MFRNFKSRFIKALFPDGGLPPYAATILMAVASLSFIAYTMLNEKFAPDAPVSLTVSATQPPPTAAPSAPSAPVVLHIAVRLTNNRDDTTTLTAPTPCEIFRWLVLSSTSKLIQAQPQQTCVQMIMTAKLEGNHHHEENFTILLDPALVHAGGDYQILVQYWGYEARTALTLE